MVGWEGIFTVLTLAVGLAVLFKDLAGPDFVFLGMLAMLMAARIVSVEEGLKGFANEAPLTVAGPWGAPHTARIAQGSCCLYDTIRVVRGGCGVYNLAALRQLIGC